MLTRKSGVLAVVDRDLLSLPYPNLTVHQGAAACLSAQTHQILLQDGSQLSYDKLCICTGAIPKVILQRLSITCRSCMYAATENSVQPVLATNDSINVLMSCAQTLKTQVNRPK